MLSSVILLGPQRHVQLVHGALGSLGIGPRSLIAVVSAGWEEREAEDQELRDHVARPVANLGIWARVERIFERDPELLLAMRERQDTLRRVQELYRLRLSGVMDAARELLRRPGDDAYLVAEREDAVQMVRELDRQHARRVADVHAEFEARWRPDERAAVLAEKRDLARLLEDCECLCVAGGHIAMLLHRLRLFDLFALYGDRPLIAWSAGAMALCERIVLFHDLPPQGGSFVEVMERGFGLIPDLVVLPHANKRIVLGDEDRLRLFARRFAPAMCVLLDPGSRLDWNGSRWTAVPGTRRLDGDGKVAEVSA
ncbi:MAG: hypothetical protein IT455_04475 [Planctomycetes bacterium]|nr:hypothetical protein [Planctomycetota bacterium]